MDGGGAYFNDYLNWDSISEFKEYIYQSPAKDIVAQLLDSKVLLEKILHIALAGYLLGLSHHFGAELSVWGLRRLMQQIAYHITLSCLIIFFSIWYTEAHGSRGPSSCMIVGSSISYDSMKQTNILPKQYTLRWIVIPCLLVLIMQYIEYIIILLLTVWKFWL